MTPEAQEQFREHLAKLPGLLRDTAEMVEAVGPCLPTCDVDDCPCRNGGLAVLVHVLGRMVRSVSRDLVVLAAWDAQVIAEVEAEAEARRVKIARQN